MLRPVLLLLLVLLLLPTCAAVDSNIFDSLSNIFKALADLCSLLGRSFRCFFNPILCVDPTAALNTCIPTTGQCVSTAVQLQAELDDLVQRVRQLCATPFDPSPEFFIDVLDARAHGAELCLRAAQSALMHQGARGYLMSSAVQRRVRESHFVAIVTPAIKHLRKEMARLSAEEMPT